MNKGAAGFWFRSWPGNNSLVLRVALDQSKGADAKTAGWQAVILQWDMCSIT
jgi:hypothetical protein